MNSSLVVALNMPVIIAAVIVTVTPLRALLEVFIPSTNRGHDAAVQMLALVVGVLWALLIVWAEQPLTRSSEIQLLITIILGISGGSGAIGAYHVAQTNTRRPPDGPASSGSSKSAEQT